MEDSKLKINWLLAALVVFIGAGVTVTKADTVVCEPQGGVNPTHPSIYWYDVTPTAFGRCDFHVRVFDSNPSNYTNWTLPDPNWQFSVHQVGSEWWASWWSPGCGTAIFSTFRFQFENQNPSIWSDWTTTIDGSSSPYAQVVDISANHRSEQDGDGYRVHVPMTEEPVFYKWVQWPDLSDINGIDVDATHWGPYPPMWDMQLLADDFYCNKTGPITDIYIWGSFYDDMLPTTGPNGVEFWLDIFNDNPSGPNGWSEPNQWLWTRTFYKGEFDVWPYSQALAEGYYSPCTGLYKTISDSNCWLYHFNIDPCNAFVQEQGNTYWLVVQALPDTYPWDPNVRFGWKTSTNHWKDDAVWATGWTGGHGPWQELRYPTGHPFEGDSIDLAFALSGIAKPLPPPVTYVDPNAPGSNNGSSWFNAYNHLQDALAYLGAQVIWVADGTYYPDTNSVIPGGSGNRFDSFTLRNGLAIYGGFAGFGAPNPDARDIKLYETILSGDLSRNDVYVSNPCNLASDLSRAENSYHVVTGSFTDATAILDGFTITGGNADSGSWPDNSGGGMFNNVADCTVNKCKSVENSADGGGGAMWNGGQSTLRVSNCIFYRNAGDDGGGAILNHESSPTLVNCSFISNKGCVSSNNGGGVYNMHNSHPTIMNCLFSNNSAQYGGGVSNIVGSCPTITNCTLSANLATGWCGGINNYNGSFPIINNCIVWDNSAAQIWDSLNSAAIVSYSDVQGGWWGAGINNINADPCFVDPNGANNTIGTLDDNFRLLWTSPCIDIGSNIAVPPDTADLDIDGITAEQTPLDLENHHRFEDGDLNGSFIIDMGAYEFGYIYLGDLDGDGDVDFVDFSIMASNWLLGVP